MPLSCLNPDLHQLLLDALETARKKVCCYSGPTCDCKYGLVPGLPEFVGTNAMKCDHTRMCEHTGCPEIRDLIGRVREGQRRTWARTARQHGRTPTHDWPCCEGENPDGQFVLPTDSLNRVCGGPGRCAQCTTEADRIHRPPAEQP